MIVKTSIRNLNQCPVRTRWDEETNLWWSSATDIVRALNISDNSRRYWNTFKQRHKELAEKCGRLKLTASDGKQYQVDVLNEEGINLFIELLPNKYRQELTDWIKLKDSPFDEQSKMKAYELFNDNLIDAIEVGTVKGLQQIHGYIFAGIFEYAGKIRDKNISKDGFVFANFQYLSSTLSKVEEMSEETFDDILNKYIEMNIAHPFMDGNGRAMRIWLDLILKKRLKKCVNWVLVNKIDYLNAMRLSPSQPQVIRKLIANALTKSIYDRELIIKGIDYSYYYEEIN
ncbi:protein adenylyltransferase Fic [Anaerorhabdus sp.]|uniref:protein adenylyltransferase Fic n=1 Tax=Anaerorhabdus sp. TaxID=1872524 RepID=UPI003FA5B7C0